MPKGQGGSYTKAYIKLSYSVVHLLKARDRYIYVLICNIKAVSDCFLTSIKKLEDASYKRCITNCYEPGSCLPHQYARMTFNPLLPSASTTYYHCFHSKPQIKKPLKKISYSNNKALVFWPTSFPLEIISFSTTDSV